jgi:hypothetical protein
MLFSLKINTMDSLQFLSEPISTGYLVGCLVLFTIFAIYHFRALNNIERSYVSLRSYPRNSWLSIIKDNREPTELRIKLTYKLAYSPDATLEELGYIGFYLNCEQGVPRELLEDRRVSRAIEYSEKQLQLIESMNNKAE